MPGRGERVYEFWVNQPLSTAFVMNSSDGLGRGSSPQRSQTTISRNS